MMAVAGLLFGALTALSCFGWGRAVCRFPLAWPVATALGLATVVALGGLLNLAGLAYGGVLDAVAAAGLALAALAFRRQRPTRPSWSLLAGLAVAMVPAVFVAATQLPITLFDFLDDFSKYFAYPIRMLATGTLAGGTLDSMGAETLGGQAFLDGFVLAHWGFDAINAVDAMFGLMLCGLMLAGLTRRAPWLVVIGVVALAVTPNHYVNVSTLYLGAALVMALVLVLCGAAECDDELPPPLAAALPAAALIAMKASFAPLVVALLLAATLAFAVTEGGRRAASWALRVAGFAALAVLPWLALHHANLLAWAAGEGGMTEAAVTQAAPSGDPLAILSFADLPYGGSYGAYSVLLAAIVALAGGTAALQWRHSHRRAATVLAVVAALTLVAFAQLEYTLPRNFGHFTLRYTIPALLGVLLALLAGVAAAPANKAARLGMALLALAPLALFGADAPTRLARMQDGKSMLAFHWLADKPDFQAFSTAMVQPEAFAHLQAIQAKVPAGEPLLAWVTTPFQLDFSRNPVFAADYSGLGTPWARLPPARWVLWEVKGWAVAGHESYRKDAASAMDYVARQGRRAMVLAARLENAANHSKVAYFDGRYVVFELTQPLDGFAASLGGRP